MTAFRPTATKATSIAAVIGPVSAWLISSILLTRETLSWSDFAAATVFVLIVAVPITLVGIVLVGLPLTLFAEWLGQGKVLPVAVGGGGLSAAGFLFAYNAEWPMIDVQQIFWLTLACTSLAFTATYLGLDRKRVEATNA